jgi:hypothetical protein
MATTIDCSRVSHVSCEGAAEAGVNASSAPAPRAPDAPALQTGVAVLKDAQGQPASGVTWECVNDCVSSQGITTLVGGATVSLGCLMVPVACPVFIGTAVGSLLGACEVACEDLESKP